MNQKDEGYRENYVVSRWHILEFIREMNERGHAITQYRIAKFFGFASHPRAMTPQLQRLKARGWIRDVPPGRIANRDPRLEHAYELGRNARKFLDYYNLFGFLDKKNEYAVRQARQAEKRGKIFEWHI